MPTMTSKLDPLWDLVLSRLAMKQGRLVSSGSCTGCLLGEPNCPTTKKEGDRDARREKHQRRLVERPRVP